MTTNLRIASFLPAATEMVYALGLGEFLVGVSHECDYPPEARDKPTLVDCVLDLSDMTMAEIDKAVSKQIGEGKSLYRVSEEKLKGAAPTLLITQDLCQVCGPAGNEVTQVLKTMKDVKILWQTPKTFDQVLSAYEELGRQTGRLEQAQAWVKQAKERVADIASKSANLPKTRVAFLEWVDPIYCGGHWVPQMLEWAGAADVNCNDGTDSVRISWDKVIEWAPEVIIVAPCGFKADKAFEQAKTLQSRHGYDELPAVKNGRVFAVDANSYYARPGPRVVEGVEILAHLAHPDVFSWNGPSDAFARVQHEKLEQ